MAKNGQCGHYVADLVVRLDLVANGITDYVFRFRCGPASSVSNEISDNSIPGARLSVQQTTDLENHEKTQTFGVCYSFIFFLS